MYTVGQRLQIDVGLLARCEGEVVCGSPEQPTNMVTVRIMFWGRPLDVELPVCQVRATGGSDDTE